jgi:hypothetical protein
MQQQFAQKEKAAKEESLRLLAQRAPDSRSVQHRDHHPLAGL